MKLKILILVFATINTLYAECLTSYEKKFLKSDIESYNEMLGEGNYIECKTQTTPLEKFVCSHPDYLLMFNDYTGTDTAFWLRNLNMEYDYDKVKKAAMNYFYGEYNTDPINENHLCFDLKKFTSDGSGISYPYKLISIKEHHDYVVQENKHGAVLTDRDGYKIYLGKTCDVADSKNNKGRWFHDADTYSIEINGTQLDFSADSLGLEQYDCHR